MTRLTRTERNDHKALLSEWHSPSEMKARAEHLMRGLGHEDLFNQTDLTFIREAWLAGVFGEKRGASSVRLVHAPRPDFEMQLGDQIEVYESVEADRLDRKRGREYTAHPTGENPVEDWPSEEWATAELAAEAIYDKALKKATRYQALTKANIPYPPNTSLFIYLNLEDGGLTLDNGVHHSAIEATFYTAVEPAIRWFSSIWILWDGRPYRVWPTSAAVPK